jgi:hypothetical protein
MNMRNEKKRQTQMPTNYFFGDSVGVSSLKVSINSSESESNCKSKSSIFLEVE